MRRTLSLLWALLFALSAAAQTAPLLLLPPPLPPVSAEAQETLTKALPLVWQKVFGKWTVVTFHRESPSLQRAKREGKLPPEALTKPYEHAERLCAIEGAKAALWVRVTRADGEMPQALEVRLLVPFDARFETDLTEMPVTEEERKRLRPFSPRPPAPEWVLALRLGQWLQETLTKPSETGAAPSEETPSDLKGVEALLKEGKWDEAVLALSRLIAETPTDPALYLRLGQVYEGRGRWQDALLEYRRAVQLQPDLWEAWKGIARTARELNRNEMVLEAVRQLRKAPEVEPYFLLLGSRAATSLAEAAQRRGRDREAETFRKEAIELDAALLPLSDEPMTLLEVAERLLAHGRPSLAEKALIKLLPKLPANGSLQERVLRLTGTLKRFDLSYQVLTETAKTQPSLSLGTASFRIALAAMDAQAVRLFERVRDDLSAFDALKLSKDDLLARLQKVNADAEQLMRTAHALKPPSPFSRTYDRRLLSYELFLQATTLLLQWVEQPDDLTRRRAVVLFEFSRTELEQVWSEERRLR
ncbi:MAG: hypothetical protein C4295_06695 [Candidatus Fervidibacterota bacterium]